MTSFTPSEPVIRHRGGERDENGEFTAEDSPVTLLALAVAPGAGSDESERSRTGESTACTVYFPAGTDVVNGDELTVRGKRFQIVVSTWQISSSPIGGLEVRCLRSEG